MASWDTTRSHKIEDSFRPTLVNRAKKRHGIQVGQGKWIVDGNPKLGDQYDQYFVVLPEGERKYRCSCQGHQGGEYRKICSHIVYITLARKGKVDIDVDIQEEPQQNTGVLDVTPEQRVTYPLRGVLPYVEDSGASIEEAREALDKEFNSDREYRPLPSWIQYVRQGQVDALEQVLEMYAEGKKVVFLDAPTGCLAGDTVVTINRGGASKRMRIEDLVHKFNGGLTAKGRSEVPTVGWDLSIPTRISRAADGVMRLATIKDAWVSGIQKTYRLTTEGGRQIEATATHPFLLKGIRTDHEDWKQLGELKVGDRIRVSDGQGTETNKRKPWYRIVNGLHHHPNAGRRGVNPDKGGWSVVQHRLVVEADMNGVGYSEWVQAHRSGNTEPQWVYLDPNTDVVHHLDHDTFNNELSNLTVLTSAEHGRLHGDTNASNVLHQIGLDVVESIEYIGDQQTYDIEVEDSPHNFIANGFVVHNSGKTLIGEMVRRKVSPGRTIYTCSTLTLQDQFLEDFDYADVIKGRANYPTMNHPTRFPTINASQCTRTGGNKTECELCEEIGLCPYESAKATALKSKLAVANIAYLLTMANYQNKFTDQPLIIIDEADVLEQQLLGFVTVSISKRNMVKYGIQPPEKKTVMSSWVEWIRSEAHPKLIARIDEIKDTPGYSRDKNLEDERSKLQQLVSRLKVLGGWDYEARAWLDEEHGLEGWVYMDYEKGDATFKPITVADYAQDILWSHAKKWLLMSATIISAQQMAEDLGLDDDEWGVVTMESDFPVESRPIYVQPVANMTWKERDVAWPAMAKAVGKIAEYHQGERVLVHTVSYALARYLEDNMVASQRHRVHTYTNSREREPALRRWLDRSTDGVMLAPSFDRGVDLKGDLCRVVVVAKIPYPNLKDKQVNGRLYSKGGKGQGWYSMLTIRSVVQMTGRAMRSRDDASETYILDKQFVKNIMNKNRKMLPKWWSEALVKSGAPRDRGLR